MKLLPYKYRKYAWVAFGISMILGINEFLRGYSLGYTGGNVQNSENYALIPFLNYPIVGHLADILLLLTVVLVVFTKDKIHDEYVESMKYKSFAYVLLGSGILAIFWGFFDHDRSVDLMMVVLLQLLLYLLIQLGLKD